MGENRSEILATSQNGQVKNAEVVQAKRKRMMLAEVYVHKSRKLDTDPNKDDHFDVFHIYEFDDNDSNTKITPKLSTNCTEPRKIIEVLRNSTGSDTPQLQRLIEKLCAQNKKWADQNNKNTIPNATNATNGNKTTPAETNVQRVSPAATPVTVIPVSVAAPLIRVKALESMKESNQPANQPKNVVTPKPMTPPASASRVNQSTAAQILKQTASAAKKGPLPTLRPSEIPKNGTQFTKTPTAGNKPTSNNPVKLWNNVIQQNNTEKDLDYLVVSTEDATTDESVFCLKPTNEVIENATENSSALKIGQVFECVSDEFVEDLLVERRTPKRTSASPMLDTLVQEVVDNHNRPKVAEKNYGKKPTQTNDNSTPIDLIPVQNPCSDFRCNICLEFNDSFAEYKSHMYRAHQYNIVCEQCHDVFNHRQQFNLHLDRQTQLCTNSENSKRTFICIVDPPVILMKNNKVFAFRCKHCSVAFHNQRNYVQHAQRHAKLFRCKLCQTNSKPMTVTAMQNHLKQH